MGLQEMNGVADNRCGLELELQPRAVCRSAAALPSAMEVSTWEWAGVQEVDISPFFSWSGSRYYALASYRCDRTVRRQFDAMSETRLQQEQASGEDASESILRIQNLTDFTCITCGVHRQKRLGKRLLAHQMVSTASAL